MKKLLTFVIASVIAIVGCSTNPVTGKRELMLIPESQELEIGRENYAPLRQMQGGDYVADPKVVEYVREVGQKLAAVADRKLPYEFHVVNDSTPNAWALPGGKISVNRGLLTELENEAQLAAVLGHEIVHSAAKHTARQMSRGVLLQGAVFATALSARNKDYAQLAELGANVGAQLLTLKYSRDAEREADYYGMKYMKKAGYDPAQAVELQRIFLRLANNRTPGWLEGLFASHPPSQERLKNNEEALKKFPPGGYLGRDRYRRVMAHLKETKPAYEYYDQGRKALAEGDYELARALAEKAIEIEPRESLFYALRGDAEAKAGNLDTAKRYYDTAVDLNPGFFRNRLNRGLIEAKLGMESDAERDLKASIELLPTSEAYYELGILAEKRGDLKAAKSYFEKGATDKSPAGIKAYKALVNLDLAGNPSRYVRVVTGIDKKSGRYKARLTNLTPMDLSGLVIAINFVDSVGRERQIQLPINGVLKAKSSDLVDLGLKQSSGIEGVRAAIVAARPVEK